MASGHKHCLPFGSFVCDSFVQLSLLECKVISTLIVLCECLVNQFKSCIDDLVVLDGIDSIGLTQEVHVSRLLD